MKKNFSKPYIAGVLSHHQLVGLSQVLCRNRRIQTPGDVHRLAALVLYVVRSPEVGIGRSRIADAVRLEFANKEQNTAAALKKIKSYSVTRKFKLLL